MREGYIIDFESRSRLLLEDVGADAYWHHPGTEILCIGYAHTSNPDDAGVIGYGANWAEENEFKLKILASNFISFGDFDFVAWNAMFPNYQIHTSRFVDLQVLAGAKGLPNDVETVAEELRLANKKSADGHKLMLKMCKPEKKTGKFFWTLEAQDKLEQYCLMDALAEREMYQKLQDFSVETEEAVHELHTRINQAGVLLDRALLEGATGAVEEFSAKYAGEVERKHGISLTSRKQVMEWAASKGWPLAGYAKDDVAAALEDDCLHPEVREVLDARQLTAYSSVKKYRSMLDRMGPGDRLRYSYKMNGAIRTGRFSASGSQLHNFARGDKALKKKREEIISALTHRDLPGLIKITNGNPMLGAATVLRNALIADEGTVFVAMDYSAIEARLVMWEAGARGLEVFRKFDQGLGPEPYKVYASVIFGVPIDQVAPQMRAVGKETVLGSGFGMSSKKFMERLQSYGIPCDMALAERCVKVTYRVQNPEVADYETGLWAKLGRAAMTAMRCRGAVIDAGLPVPIKFGFDGCSLIMKLPSGRKLYYWKAEVNMAGKYGEEITYMTHGSEQGKNLGWHRTQTHGAKICENATQAISADLTRDAMLKISRRYPVRLHTHDEIVVCAKESEVEECKAYMKKCMCEGPAWSSGIPIAVAGWVDKRFIKD